MPLGGYSKVRTPGMEFRIPDAGSQFAPARMKGRFRFWMRATQQLPEDARIHTAAFAYISDRWITFCALGWHLRELGTRELYISSLNHGIWLHRPVRADQWLHVDCVSPCATTGRGLSVATVHHRSGRSMASLAQECLMAYAE